MRVHRSSARSVALLVAGLVVAPAITEVIPRAHAQGAPAEDPALFRELVLRALGDSEGAKVTVVVGRLPEAQPALVTPAGWRLLGHLSRVFPAPPGLRSTGTMTSVHFDAPAGTVDAANVLATALVAAGWRNPPQGTGPTTPGGFVPAGTTRPSYALLCGTDGKMLNINSNGSTTGPVPVTAQLNSFPEGPSGVSFGGPCSPPGSASGPPTTIPPFFVNTYGQIPPLAVPAGAKFISGGGGGGSPFSASTSAVIEVAASPTDLEATFAAQLQTAGWRRISGVTAPSIATSVWRKTADKTDFQGVLQVVTALGGDQRRELSFSVSTAVVEGQFGYGGLAYPVPPPVLAPGPVATVVAAAAAPAQVQSAQGFVAGGPKSGAAAKKPLPKKPIARRVRKG